MIADTRHILRTYLRRLTNLSGNNRSLVLLRLHSEQVMDLHSLSFLNNEKSFTIIEALIAGRQKKLCALADSRMEAVNQTSAKLKKLQRLDRFIFDERGSNDLHVGWPLVHGKFADGTAVCAPLLYFPVTLAEENNQWVLQPRKEAGITFNKSFLLAYSFYTNTPLPADLPETSFDDFTDDSTAFRTQLYQLLKNTIEINFNSNTFTDELQHFQEFTKDEFEATHHAGELKLHQQAVLGIFPQAGSQLVPDYMHLIESEAFADLEDFFAQRTGASQSVQSWVTSVKEEKIHTPFPQDAYQEHTLRLVKDGRSVVVQGPPGTGKSQLIANLMADGIAAGKKTLLVCQKRVALDVVYDRLKKIGLEDFLGLVHDFRNDRKTVFDKIARQIDRIDDYKIQDRSVDVIQLERRFLQVSHAIDQLTEELEEFRTALFDENECGIDIKELYLTSDPQAESVALRQEYQTFHFSTLSDFSTLLKRYARYAAMFEPDDYLWKRRKSFAGFSLSDVRNIEAIIRDIETFQQKIQHELQNILPSLNLLELENLLERRPEAEQVQRLLANDTLFADFQKMVTETNDETSLLWLQNMERVCMNCFEDPGLESTLESARLGELQIALQKRMESRKGLIRRIRWEMSEHKFLLKRVLIGSGLKFNKQGLRTLEQRLDHRLNLEHHLTALRKKEWLGNDLPTDRNQQMLQQWFMRKLQAAQAKLSYHTLRELQSAINIQKLTHADFRQTLQHIFTTLDTVPAQRESWQQYLTAYQIQQLILQPGLQTDFIKTLRSDFDHLVEFDKIQSSLPDHEKIVIRKLHEHLHDWDSDKLETLFQNSIRLAWIEHIETKYPVLRMASTFRMEETETALRKNLAEKQAISTQILKLRAREHTYDQLEYNRLNNRITYRDLDHQTTKKKKIWPLRKVIATFSNELFNLIPCWMASPEAVSAIFPMEQLFDLVIFDEASQCFSERGIPAMYRGKQVVVAGDDKQLKPFELYQIRWTEEDTSPELEVTSLLQLAARYLPTVHLQGHYRSKSLALIEFSNQHFYEGRLKLLPDRKTFNASDVPIQFNRVNGVWTQQTNLPEAQAVVDHALHLMVRHPEKEIGIITFNMPQQVMILDLLEEKANQHNITLPDSLFVKNIENVQGDEKDIIIFSIGYAPDENGKLALQFGSLNVAGGENRLNVAITRARERIVIFSSIAPEDLKLQGIKNDGPKLLKKYLEYAQAISENREALQPDVVQHEAPQWYLHQHLAAHSKTLNPPLLFSAKTLPFTDAVVMQTMANAALLTDDGNYKNALTAKEAHAYTPVLLEQKHWPNHRFFSRNWWLNRQKTLQELTKFIFRVTEN